MTFNFTVKEFILGNGTGAPTLQFYRKGFELGGGDNVWVKCGNPVTVVIS